MEYRPVLYIRVRRDVADAAHLIAERYGVTLTQVVCRAMERYLEEECGMQFPERLRLP